MTARTPTQRHAVVCGAQQALVAAAKVWTDAWAGNNNDREIYRRRLFDAALEHARVVRAHMRNR